MSKVLPRIPGKVGHFMQCSVSGCRILIDFFLLGYFCQSINSLDVAMCSIKCHQQIENSQDSTKSFQQLAVNVSKLKLNYCMICSLFPLSHLTSNGSIGRSNV